MNSAVSMGWSNREQMMRAVGLALHEKRWLEALGSLRQSRHLSSVPCRGDQDNPLNFILKGGRVGPGSGGILYGLSWFWLVFGLSMMDQKKIENKNSFDPPPHFPLKKIGRYFRGVFFGKITQMDVLTKKIKIDQFFSGLFFNSSIEELGFKKKS